MIQYLALFIPVWAAMYAYYRDRHYRDLKLWHLAVFLFINLFAVIAIQLIGEKSMMSCKEYWGSMVQTVEYYEEWDEWIEETCTRSYPCGTDDKGNTKYCTETYDCSYCRTHEPEYKIITTTGATINIGKERYENLRDRLGNSVFVELNRDYYHKDGDKYCSTWYGNVSNSIPVTTEHTYDNRVKISDQSVFHHYKVTKEDQKKYNLKEYPSLVDDYNMRAVLGDSSADAVRADTQFQRINGLIGSKKQVRVYVLIYKDQPIEASFYQESLWSGGNKNEFVICIGIDKQRAVKWARCFSWTKREDLKISIKNFVEQQQILNLDSLSTFALQELDRKFVRRPFKEFDYLMVELTAGWIILIYVVVGLLSALLLYLASVETEQY